MMNMRNKLVPFFAVLTAAGLLTGCSGQRADAEKGKVGTGNESTVQGAESPDKNISSSAVKEGMRTVQTDKGQVEIPENPQTIVSDYYLGEFLAVDVKPAIASPYSLSNPFLSDKIGLDIKEMDITSAETSLEMIVAKEPDLIVTIQRRIMRNILKLLPLFIFRTEREVMRKSSAILPIW